METADKHTVDWAVGDLRECYFGELRTDFSNLEAAVKTIRDLGVEDLLAEADDRRAEIEPAKVIVENYLRFLYDHPRRQAVKSTDFAAGTSEWRVLRQLEDKPTPAAPEVHQATVEERVFQHLDWYDYAIDRALLLRALSCMYADLGNTMGGLGALLRLRPLAELVEA
jgi:hypothetical protein